MNVNPTKSPIKSVIRNFADPKEADIKPGKEIIIGTFVDEEKPNYFGIYNRLLKQKIEGG